MGLYLTPQAIKWAVYSLSNLPKNQTALFFFLIFAKCPDVDRTSVARRTRFEEEFHRYFGGPIKGGGIAVYDPFGKEWRAEQYINSTVYGRLLVGSHKWTEGSEAFFSRKPKSGGWPAKFELTEEGFDALKYRSSPPCLKYEYRLPLTATAIYYFRFDDLSPYNPTNLDDLISLYRKIVITTHPKLHLLFQESQKLSGMELFRRDPLSESEKLSCFPPSPFSTEEKTRALLYVDDVDLIDSRLKAGESIADYVRYLLRGTKP